MDQQNPQGMGPQQPVNEGIGATQELPSYQQVVNQDQNYSPAAPAPAYPQTQAQTQAQAQPQVQSAMPVSGQPQPQAQGQAQVPSQTQGAAQSPAQTQAQPQPQPQPVRGSEPVFYPQQVQILSEPPRRRNKEKRRPGWVSLAVCTLLAGVLGSGITVGGLQAGGYLSPWGSRSVAAQQDNRETQVAPVVNAKGNAANWQAVNEAVGPTVVLIQVRAGNSGGTGSGVIIDPEGHIVTNYHVIADMVNNTDGRMQVKLADGRVLKASIVGTDKETDLAVIKLDQVPKGLTHAQFGNSNDLKVGQPVAAIGAPLELQSTMTTGIISALNRPTVVAERDRENPEGGSRVFTNAIQIDASINPGNSGGPLFDAQGRVIGINSSIISLTANAQGQAGSIGLGFAIPSDLVKKVANAIIKDGHFEHALLGIGIKGGGSVEIDGTLRTGALVGNIDENSKMGKAGLKAGDLIVGIDGMPVNDAQSLIGYVRRYTPGEQVTLEVYRDKKKLEITGPLISADAVNS
ncbi:hypothetical protein BSR28_05805 [Boudabousia liubingyangii]|uniref:S1C family serine protease n=1 Tax=Boudabousia liubingyangii TaxID=1921764 RepID=UPI0009394A81|nr:trypsin-like peptidase domain-containing protein [Boudabousia liubingyangii]OKL46936.1 hypothetical protein BSR28_05805 [Boudabousia liubingyangii]